MATHQKSSDDSARLNEMTFEVRFLPEGKRASVAEGSTLMTAAMNADVDLANICGGKGYCGKCQVELIEGKLSDLTVMEQKRISPEKIAKGFRLACQAKVLGNVTVKVPDQSRVGRQRLVIMGKEPRVEIRSNVQKLFLEIPPPTLHDLVADDERLMQAIAAKTGKKPKLDYILSKIAPRILREGEFNVTATLLANETVVNIQKGDTTRSSYGVAVDIGTTKLAVFLVDLNDGSIIFADGIMNPQIRFGEDVISRINYASQGPRELEEVQETIVAGINELIQKGLDETGVLREDVNEMVVVGNTAMHHLFVGIDVKSLGLAPYAAGMGNANDFLARDLGIRINPSGNVHVLPNVAGFVGADAIADILASRLHEKEKMTLLMDVGTNTEVMLGNKEGIWSCSTASGPAFEGAHIRNGMRAATGAIEKVKITESGEVVCKTIEDEKARGICGSGIIDSVAEMLRSGIMDTSGRILIGVSDRVRDGPNGREFLLVPKEETSSGKEDIVVTQDDVREIQKAKAAMYAGYMTLLRKSGMRKDQLSEIIIAGAFGNYIDPASARIIGMIPEMPLEKISFTGNTAGSGARMCLKSLDARGEAKEVARKMKYVELAAEPIFVEEYINAMYLPNSSLEDFPETTSSIKAPKVVKKYVRR
ncbi:MAG: ASKHA domain-containing protein [Candidatus Methanomethylicia archaeon]|nr:ASKHA domain-containing protein [Candidatus Methanomethylicia archaeon]